MPIISNFPKRLTYVSDKSRGLMTKEDVSFIHSLQDKLDIVGNIVGRKIYSFASINDVKEAINLRNNDVIIVLGSENILDDGYIKIMLVSDNKSYAYDKSVIPLLNNLYAKILSKIVDNKDINKRISEVIVSLKDDIKVQEDNIANIIASAGKADCEEINNAKIDENGIPFSSMKDRINSIADNISIKGIKKYGVKFTGNHYNGERLYDACGTIAYPSTNTVFDTNDFDNIYPWSDIVRCNGYYTDDGFIVTAYDGEPGFALDGSNGNVWVEIPVFYIRETLDSYNNLIMELSPYQLSGYRLPEKFINSDGTIKDKEYIAAYNLSEYGSVSGKDLLSGSYNTLLDTIYEKHGFDFCGYTMDDYEIIRFLFCIEYATRNSQTVMTGATNISHIIKLPKTKDTNIIDISTPVSLVPGLECFITDSKGKIIYDNIIITNVTTEGEITHITFSGDPITTLSTYTLKIKPWRIGSTDSVLGPSGSPNGNMLGYYPCRYRFIENPWGNQWSVLYQVAVKNKDIYFCKQSEMLYDIISEERKLSEYTLPLSNGYITSLGFDKKYPSCRLPKDLEGGSSYTNYGDIFMTNNLTDPMAVLVGGYIESQMSGGLHCINTMHSFNSIDLWIGTRLSHSK